MFLTFQRYDVQYVEFLAQGGYGWVSLVYDDTEKRPLAIKCTVDTSEMELTWWPKLQHDTILPLIEYITLDSCTVFIMPAMRKDLWICFDLTFQQVPAKFHFLELYEPPEFTHWCHGQAPSAITNAVQFTGDKADMWQYGILSLDLLTNLSLSGDRSNYFTLWHHDVWPFVQKVLLHREYLEYLMEDTFQNVFFNPLDFELCHEFLEQILIIEPNARVSAAEAMKHEFVNVDWPHMPASFGMPKQITAHPSKQRSKEVMKKPVAEVEKEAGEVPLAESAAQAAEVLKKKKEKLQKQKQERRQSFAAIAGKNPLMIRHNISGMNVEADRSTSHELSMSDIEVRDNIVIKKSVEPNTRSNSENRNPGTKKIASISPYKKLQPKINRDPAKSTSSQLGRSSRSSTEQVTRFLSSSDKNPKSKSPVRKVSEPKGKSPSAKKSASAARKNSPALKKSSNTKKSPQDEKSPSKPKDSKIPSSRKSPKGSQGSTTAKNSPRFRKTPGNPKSSSKDQENTARSRKSASDKDDKMKDQTSTDDQKNTAKSAEDSEKSTASSDKDSKVTKNISFGSQEGRKVSSHEISHQNLLEYETPRQSGI
ncbi:hypothetical protein HNY73_014303 [Argiope bruennichi]|uniref:Protein kinase domain-containing protein n=1 Tax=Argiope bruennichi TaxID=94029 RepID=A0A8T0EPZ0_ARGBR|nr:hypothetical protein HNY73_014303 [Argiope bruennichi]